MGKNFLGIIFVFVSLWILRKYLNIKYPRGKWDICFKHKSFYKEMCEVSLQVVVAGEAKMSISLEEIVQVTS